MSMGDKEFKAELRKLNQELQKENAERVNRIREHKRQQIIDAHIAFKEKNEKKKKASLLYDCYLRKQAVNENEARELAYKLMEKLTKTDPSKITEREKLVKTLTDLNEKLKLGMELKFPVRKKKPENEDEENEENNEKKDEVVRKSQRKAY